MAQTFRELLAKFPQTKLRGLAAFSVGDYLFTQRDYAGAEPYLLDARKADPAQWNQPATQRLALAAYGRKDWTKLLNYVQDYGAIPGAEKAAPLPAPLFYALAQNAQTSGDLAVAEGAYKRVTIAPDAGDLLAPAWWQLGQVETALKEWPDAVASYQRYQQLKPDAAKATKVLLALGRAQLGAGTLDAAKATAQQALLQEPEGPNSAAARMLLAETSYAAGSYAEAARMFATLALLFDNTPIAPQAMSRAADSFEKAGDAKSAADWRAKLQAKYPAIPACLIFIGATGSRSRVIFHLRRPAAWRMLPHEAAGCESCVHGKRTGPAAASTALSRHGGGTGGGDPHRRRAGSTNRNGTVSVASLFGMARKSSCSRRGRGPWVAISRKSWRPCGACPFRGCVLDGELVDPHGGRRLRSSEFQMRLHPAESRVRKLAAAHPARFVIFDLLVDAGGASSGRGHPLRERRSALEKLFELVPADPRLVLSPAVGARGQARRWLSRAGGDLDGVIAKRLDCAYRSGLRDGMVKIKNIRTVDCVVGGFRYGEDSPLVGSLLLGLYDVEGLLHHVGFTSALAAEEKARADPQAGEVDSRSRLHRQRAGRAEPLEHAPQRGMAAARAEARGRGDLRSCHGPAIPPRNESRALASRTSHRNNVFWRRLPPKKRPPFCTRLGRTSLRLAGRRRSRLQPPNKLKWNEAPSQPNY